MGHGSNNYFAVKLKGLRGIVWFGGLTGVFPFWDRIMLREACRRGFDEVVGKLALTTAGAKARIHAKALIRSAKALRHPESNPPKIKPPKIKFSREPFPRRDGKPRKWVEVVDTGAKPNSPAFRRGCSDRSPWTFRARFRAPARFQPGSP